VWHVDAGDPTAAAQLRKEEGDLGGAGPANRPQAKSFWASAGGKRWAAPRVLGLTAYGLPK
jgi:hypothetical protein